MLNTVSFTRASGKSVDRILATENQVKDASLYGLSHGEWVPSLLSLSFLDRQLLVLLVLKWDSKEVSKFLPMNQLYSLIDRLHRSRGYQNKWYHFWKGSSKKWIWQWHWLSESKLLYSHVPFCTESKFSSSWACILPEHPKCQNTLKTVGANICASLWTHMYMYYVAINMISSAQCYDPLAPMRLRCFCCYFITLTIKSHVNVWIFYSQIIKILCSYLLNIKKH